MLQKAKKPIALLSAFFMVLTLFSGIVLPQVADPAFAAAAPYAEGDATMTQVTPTDNGDGTYSITVGGNTYAVPAEYAAATINVPNDQAYFYCRSWTAENLGINGDKGEVFFKEYGDGTTYGNGNVYMMKWRENAFGATNYFADYTIPSGSTETKYPGWQQMICQELLTAQPHEGDTEGNKRFVYLWPGSFTNSTGSTGSNADMTCLRPIDSEGNELTDPVEEDLLNIYFYGPQAGRTPFTEDSLAVANGRGADTSKEMVFTSTFWAMFNASVHWDGVSIKGTCSLYFPSSATDKAWNAIHFENTYIERTSGTTKDSSTGKVKTARPIFNVGEIGATSQRVTKFYMDNSYVKVNATDAIASDQKLQANICEITNTTMTGLQVATDDQYSQNMECQVGTCAAAAANCAFLGDYSGSAKFLLQNCNIIDYDPNHIFRFNFVNYQKGYSKNCDIIIDGNYYYNEDTPGTGNILNMNNVKTANGTKAKLTITDNYAYYGPALDGKRPFAGNTFTDGISGGVVMTGNTVVSNGSGYLFYSIPNLAQVDNNLNLDYDGNVLPIRASYVSNNYTGNASILSGLVASDLFYGNLSDLFTVQRTNANLIVTYSCLELIKTTATTDGTIKGTATLLCEDGVTYPTAGLFRFRDGVEFDGIYSDAACTTPKATIAKGFGTAYAKAHYSAGNTTATVIYTLAEPTKYIVVDPTGEGSYTFNGETYDDGNATFVDTLEAAKSSFTTPNVFTATPCTSVVLVMPGEYGDISMTAELKSFAMVGPQAFNCPVADNAKLDQNVKGGRSIDTSTEAVFTGYVSFPPGNGSYVSIAGVASNRVGKNAFTVDTVENKDRINFLTLQNVYTEGTSTFIGRTNKTANRALVNAYVKGCYSQGTTGTLYSAQLSNLFVEHTGHMNCDGSGSYLYNDRSSILAIKPISSNVSFTDGFMVGKGGSYMICPAWRNNSRDVEDFAEGMGVTVDNMYFAISSNKPTIRLMPGAPETEKIVITNNYFNTTAQTTAPVIDQYTDNANTADKKFKSAVVTGNVFKGASDLPYQFDYGSFSNSAEIHLNNVDVTENVYLDAAGKAMAISENCTGIQMPEYYYLDENRLFVSSDLDMDFDLDGQFYKATPAGKSAANRDELVGDEIVIPYNESLTVADITDGCTFAPSDVEVKGLFNSDGTPATAIANGGSYKLRVGYTDDPYTAVYPITITQDIGDTPIYDGADYFYDPAVASLRDGMYYIAALDGTDYAFVVGTNVFDSFAAVPKDGNVKKIHLFAKQYDTLPQISWNDDTEWEIYGAKAGVNPVEIDTETGIPTGNRANARGTVEADETVLTNNAGAWTVSAARIVVDGIAFKGEVHRNASTDSSSVNAIINIGTGKTVAPIFEIRNCVTIEGAPVVNINQNGIIAAKSGADHKGIIENNFIEFAGNKGNGFATWRVTSETVVQNNFMGCVDGAGASRLFYFSDRTSTYVATDTLVSDFGMTISNNRFVGNLTFSNGEKDEDTAAAASYRLLIDTNYFTAVDNGEIVYINKDAGFVPGTQNVQISNNTFDNAIGAKVYAINNSYIDDVAVIDNTFKGFAYNYGNKNILDASVAANGDAVEFIGNTFVMADGTYADNAVDADTELADLAPNATVDAVNKTIAFVSQDANYVFAPANGMMVKATVTNDEVDTVYYNYVPTAAADKVEVVMIKLNGDEVGEAYEVTSRKDPFVLNWSAATKVIGDAAPFATYWEGTVSGATDWNLEIFNQMDVKVLDYGMFYSNLSGDFDKNTYDAQGYYTNTETGKKTARKVSYVNGGNADGLDGVKSVYSFKFGGVNADKYRYGKMYLTYQVGTEVYTIVSDQAELHTPAAE